MREALATAMRTRSLALAVANSGSLEWTQEHWFRILAISMRYLLRPASFRVSWNRGSWVLGVQAATTIRFRPFFSITCFILSWVSWEQVNIFSSTKATWGRVLA